VTARGDYFALQLARHGVPVSDYVRDVCSRVARCAVTLIRLEEEQCNGPADRLPVWDVEKWQTGLELRTEQAEKRFGRLMGELREAVAKADADGANKYVGGWESSVYGVFVDVFHNGNGDDVRKVSVTA